MENVNLRHEELIEILNKVVLAATICIVYPHVCQLMMDYKCLKHKLQIISNHFKKMFISSSSMAIGKNKGEKEHT